MPIVIKALTGNEPGAGGGSNSKQKKNKKYTGALPKSKPPPHARPNHPMNTERTGPSVMKVDPDYKSAGGMVYKGR